MAGDQQAMRSLDDLAVRLLRRGEGLRIKARGGSMSPFLRDGDVALVVPTAGGDVAIGDVICYEAPPGRLFLHRVIARHREGLLAKGDALASTEVVDRAQLLGTVVAVERQGQVRRLDTPAGRWQNRLMALVSRWLPWLRPVAAPLRRAWRAAVDG